MLFCLDGAHRGQLQGIQILRELFGNLLDVLRSAVTPERMSCSLA
jgi:hypothetical protein